MTFDAAPSLPWDVKTPLDARVEILLNTAWTDISPWVFMDTTAVQRGHPDESTTASPSAFPATLDNSDGRFSQLNPLSPYYPFLGLNTPIRVSIPEGCSYLRLEGDGTVDQGAFCPSSTAINAILSTGFEVWIDADLDNWQAGQTLAAKWNATGNQRSWMINTLDGGHLQLLVSSDGAFTGLGGDVHFWTTFGRLDQVHGRLSIRVSYDSATGTASFYTGSMLTGWTLFERVTVASAPDPFSATSNIEVGTCSGVPSTGEGGVVPAVAMAYGKFYAFVYMPVTGSIATALASADFTVQTAGASTWTDVQGNTWSTEGGATISNRNYRFHGVAAAWPQSWTPGGANARVALSAGGLLRQLGSTQVSVQSAMRRAYTRLTGVGTVPWLYLPCEDTGLSLTQVASGIGGPPGVWNGVPQPASFSGFVCSQPLPVLDSATLTCLVPKYPSAAAATPGADSDAIVRFLMAVPAAGDATLATTIASVYFDSGTVARCDLTYGSGGSMALAGFNSAGSQLWTTGPIGFAVNGQLLRVSIELRNITNTTYNASVTTLAVGASGGGIAFGAGSSGVGVAGGINNVTRIVFNPPGGTPLAVTALGHVSLQSQWSSLFDMTGPVSAYEGELAGVRFQRLCGEEGIIFRGMGNKFDTTPMGPQTQETISNLLQECPDADRGIWYEPRQVLGFGYRSRVSIGNQTPFLILDYNQDHLSDDLSPTHDDQTVKNDVTVTNNTTGSSARAVLDDGSKNSVGDIGRYDTSIPVNLADDTLNDDEAGWILHALTVNEPRYTAINVDLGNTALASLFFQVIGVDAGDRIQVLNPPAWLPPGLIDQIVQGFNEPLSLKALKESWNGIPATPWNTGYFDDPVYGRADTDGSCLAAPVTSGATSFPVMTTQPLFPLWTTSGAEFPFDVNIGGERITVTGIGGLGLVQLQVPDGTFESGVAGWTPSNATFTQSTSQHHSGTHSGLITVTGTPSQATVRPVNPTSLTQITQGVNYVLDLWVFSTSAFTAAAVIDWRKADGSLAGTSSGGNTAVTANTWTHLSVSANPTAGATQAGFGPSLPSPASGLTVFLDDLTFDTLAQIFTVTRSVNGVVKPQSEGTDVRLFFPSILSF